jgi:ubiquinone/menaquinone biosynthesis C-methylase UbiE
MTSLPFDSAVEYYDATRGLPAPVQAAATEAIQRYAAPRPEAVMLEVGTGTGRMSIPLLERGVRVIGCDLSAPMLRRQREKYPAAVVARADAVRLPFGAGQFDGALTVHVLHLVGGWQEALREIRRVLRPGGAYLNSWHWQDDDAPDRRIRDYWRGRVEAHGAAWRRPGIQSREELTDEARRLGASVEALTVVRYVTESAPADSLQLIAQRTFSDTWHVPEPVFSRTVEELRAWAATEFGNLERARRAEQRFLLDVMRFTA